MTTRHIRLPAITASAVLIVAIEACSGSTSHAVLTADMPLHLEDHLDAATFTVLSAADVSTTNVRTPVEWRFDDAQPDWKASPM